MIRIGNEYNKSRSFHTVGILLKNSLLEEVIAMISKIE